MPMPSAMSSATSPAALPDADGLLARLAEVALAAGAAIRRIEAGGIAAELKADQSPVTLADGAAEEIICAALATLLPGVPVIAEEAMAAGGPAAAAMADRLAGGGAFLLVDPLDGTREFISGNGEYTVNIALVEGGAPVLGVVYAPARALLYAGRPGSAFRASRAPTDPVAAADWPPIASRPVPGGPTPVAASRSHGDPATDALIARYPVAERIPAGSALKFGLLAEGRVDLYPRLGTVMEWDSAAGHALVTAAGGSVSRPDGTPLTYGHPETGFRVHGFVAWGRRDGSAQG